MNRGEFIELLENPEGGNPTTIRDLDELIGIFPYFHGAHMLLLKVLKENADIRFEKRLKQGAIFVADRELLYYYLMEKPEQIDVAPAPTSAPTIASAETLTAPAPPLTAGEEVVPETAVSPEKAAAAPTGTVEEKVDDEGAVTIAVGAGGMDIDEPLLLSGDIESIDIDDIRVESGEGLLILDESPEMEELETAPESAEIFEIIEHDGPAVPGAEDSSPLSDDELIERFIANNPRISPIGEAHEEREPTDISQPFTENTEGLVSETLAKIYIKQKYYYRALDIYKKLSLKYPEKNSYFAGQIQTIKDLINQK